MKENHILYIFFTVIFCFVVFINTNIYSQQFFLAGSVPNPGTEPSISVVDGNNVWIAGGVPDTPRVFRTTNGGLNWIQVPVDGISKEIFCIWAIDPATVFVGEGIVNSSARLFKTTNAGVNWTPVLQTGQNQGSFNNLIFSYTNPLAGAVLANNIYVTTNGGNNWVMISTGGNGVSSAHNSLMFVDENFFGFGFTNGTSRVRVTANGGTSWTNQNVNLTGNYTNGFAYSVDKLTGLASTSTSMPNLARTTNGGITWNSLNIGAGLTGTTLIKWVPGTEVVYIIGANGAMMRSTNNGLIWNSLSTGGVTGITHFSFIKLYGVIHGFAVSSNGSVVRFVDSVLNGPMPVELVSFTSNVEKNNVRIKWITNNEVNNKGFYIERTIKGNNENWVEKGFINGNGNINIPVTYEFLDKNVNVGVYKYRLKQTDYNGNFEYFNLANEVEIGVPDKFSISQNYPNPFNPITKIDFDLPFDSKVSIKLYDLSGREVMTLLNEQKSAGYYTVQMNGINLSSGMYYYKITAGNFTAVKKMLMIK